MITITQSVGENGKNLEPDVRSIQKALNRIQPPPGATPLVENGLYDDSTGNAIIAFQKVHVMMIHPDGRIDPGGRTIKKLGQMQRTATPRQGLLFPLDFKPAEGYKTGMRAFGANRANGKRRHAGVDLYAPKDTPVRAMTDGTVIREYPFYLGTRALEIDHGDMVVRYGEIARVADGITDGTRVFRGQVIAYVGELVFESGNKMSMLHLETYDGTSTGPLTLRSASPYQRRSDLFDPTTLLDGAAME